MTARPEISGERLLAELRELGRIGGRPDGGVDRVAGSPADLEARLWLRGRMEASGLEARADETNNVFARAPGTSAPWLLVGSHTDTVPAGGRLDGAYGVMAALEVLRTLYDARHPASSGLEIVSFHNEEGVAGGGGFSGSRALTRATHGREISGYVEIHIEQGPTLDAAGEAIAVVESIVGIRRLKVVITGEPNHAGTTPYAARRDAGAAAAKLAWQVRDILQDVDPSMVGNVGVITFDPNSPNVVPGQATLVVEMRSSALQHVDAAQAAVEAAAQAAAHDFRCTASAETILSIAPVQMDPHIVDLMERVCARWGGRWRRMVSGAGHDAGAMASIVPAGMLFVPSRAGISHSPLEHTDDGFLVQGAQLLLESVVELAADSPA